MLGKWHIENVECRMYGMWDVEDVGYSGCGMFGMWDVQDAMFEMWDVRDVGCRGSGMFGMWDVQDVGCGDVRCSGCGMFGMWDVGGWGGGRMWDVRNVGCSGCGMFGMWDVGYLPGCGMLIYKMPFVDMKFSTSSLIKRFHFMDIKFVQVFCVH